MHLTQQHHISEVDIRSENDIIQQCKQHPQQFEVLYNKYFTRIFRFVYQRLDNKNLAADITQQAFLNALSNIKKYEFKGLPFVSWVYKIAYNELNAHFRKYSSDRYVNINDSHINSMLNDLIGEKIEKKDIHSKLTQALQTLAPDEMELIEMRFFEDRAFKEIGEILDITENNAKVKTYRILDKLKITLTNLL